MFCVHHFVFFVARNIRLRGSISWLMNKLMNKDAPFERDELFQKAFDSLECASSGSWIYRETSVDVWDSLHVTWHANSCHICRKVSSQYIHQLSDHSLCCHALLSKWCMLVMADLVTNVMVCWFWKWFILAQVSVWVGHLYKWVKGGWGVQSLQPRSHCSVLDAAYPLHIMGYWDSARDIHILGIIQVCWRDILAWISSSLAN